MGTAKEITTLLQEVIVAAAETQEMSNVSMMSVLGLALEVLVDIRDAGTGKVESPAPISDDDAELRQRYREAAWGKHSILSGDGIVIPRDANVELWNDAGWVQAAVLVRYDDLPPDSKADFHNQYRTAARQLYSGQGEVHVNIASPVKLIDHGRDDRPGAWVQAEVWVSESGLPPQEKRVTHANLPEQAR